MMHVSKPAEGMDFKQFEHEGWERLAQKYEDVWSSLTRQFIPPLLSGVGISPGMEVLDVACGPGYVAAEANRLGAKPVGIDFSGAMIRQARLKYPGIQFHEGDAEQLRFPNRTFEAVVMNFGILHLAHPEAALAEAHRVLRPGGRLGFTVWAGPAENPGSKIMNDAIEKYGNIKVDLPEGPEYFLFAERDQCRKTLSAAGFDEKSMTFESMTVQWIVPTSTYYFEAERDAAVRTGALLRAQSPAQLDSISAAVESAVMELATGDGYGIPMTAHVITAPVPAT